MATLFRTWIILGIPVLWGTSLSAALAPTNWPEGAMHLAEQRELDGKPAEPRTVTSSGAMISATVSPIALEAGLQALRDGGSAADAAATIALTQVATCAGSVVSYAGILDGVYYDAATGEIQTLHAPWKTYAGETDAASIPPRTELEREQGRKTLVPGFMAAIEAMHQRHGRLPWNELFAPAIYYAEEGVKIGGLLGSIFPQRTETLARTTAGRVFLHQARDSLPEAGDMLYQPDLAATLRNIAEQGADYMYDGPWAAAYVEAINAAGGHASLEDLRNYEPIWQEPLTATFAGHVVHAPGAHSEGGYQLLLALNLAEAAHLPELPPYWQSPEAFFRFNVTSSLSEVLPNWPVQQARAAGVTLDLANRADPAYARLLLETLQPVVTAPPSPTTDHSETIVVVDAAGNIAALAHSINTVIWGSTGIVVGGIPIADAACVNGYRFPALQPGDYMPIDMAPALVMHDKQPVLAVAAIGYAHRRETVRLLLGLVAQGHNLATVLDAPQWLARFGNPPEVAIIEGRYDDAFIAELAERGVAVHPLPSGQRSLANGLAAFVVIDPESRELASREDPRYPMFVAVP